MESTSSDALLLALMRQRWLAPLMAQFGDRAGHRFAELRHAMGISRDSLVRALDAAQAAGWIVRNPGHGHPLRPEYLLAPPGAEAAHMAAGIVRAMGKAAVEPADLTRWSLPTLKAVHGGNERFNQLARCLPAASPRALSITLRALAANKLVDRAVEQGFPPSSRYRITDRGVLLVVQDQRTMAL